MAVEQRTIMQIKQRVDSAVERFMRMANTGNQYVSSQAVEDVVLMDLKDAQRDIDYVLESM